MKRTHDAPKELTGRLAGLVYGLPRVSTEAAGKSPTPAARSAGSSSKPEAAAVPHSYSPHFTGGAYAFVVHEGSLHLLFEGKGCNALSAGDLPAIGSLVTVTGLGPSSLASLNKRAPIYSDVHFDYAYDVMDVFELDKDAAVVFTAGELEVRR